MLEKTSKWQVAANIPPSLVLVPSESETLLFLKDRGMLPTAMKVGTKASKDQKTTTDVVKGSASCQRGPKLWPGQGRN